MSTVEELAEAIKELSDDERSRLIALLDELEADAWDRQIEADIRAGKFDEMAAKALRDNAAGRTIPL